MKPSLMEAGDWPTAGDDERPLSSCEGRRSSCRRCIAEIAQRHAQVAILLFWFCGVGTNESRDEVALKQALWTMSALSSHASETIWNVLLAVWPLRRCLLW
jgi:hypothetical protein